MSNNILDYCELYSSIKNKGFQAGQPITVLRLFGTNLIDLNDARKYSYDKNLKLAQTMRKKAIPDQLIPEFNKVGVAGKFHLLITGGEPLIQQEPLIHFLQALKETYPQMEIEIETNGTLMPKEELDKYVNRYIVNLLLSNAIKGGNRETYDFRIKKPVIEFYIESKKASFNFLIKSPEDVKNAQEVINLCKIPVSSVWMAPSCSDYIAFRTYAPLVQKTCITFGYNFSVIVDSLVFQDKPSF